MRGELTWRVKFWSSVNIRVAFNIGRQNVAAIAKLAGEFQQRTVCRFSLIVQADQRFVQAARWLKDALDYKMPKQPFSAAEGTVSA
jgi:hypothetical protein